MHIVVFKWFLLGGYNTIFIAKLMSMPSDAYYTYTHTCINMYT